MIDAIGDLDLTRGQQIKNKMDFKAQIVQGLLDGTIGAVEARTALEILESIERDKRVLENDAIFGPIDFSNLEVPTEL